MPSVYVCVCVFIILLFATSSHALLQCCAKRGSGKGGEGGPQSPQCSIFEGCKEEKALQNIKQRDIAGEDDQTCCLFQCEKHAQCDGKAKIDGADKKFVAYGELESEKVRRLYLSFCLAYTTAARMRGIHSWVVLLLQCCADKVPNEPVPSDNGSKCVHYSCTEGKLKQGADNIVGSDDTTCCCTPVSERGDNSLLATCCDEPDDDDEDDDHDDFIASRKHSGRKRRHTYYSGFGTIDVSDWTNKDGTMVANFGDVDGGIGNNVGRACCKKGKGSCCN